MKRITLLLVFPFFVQTFFAPTLAAHSGQGPPERPNILLLVAEDMSSRVGAFGDNVAVTPTLDKLATEGVRYTQVFTTAGVCAPSRAAHILGMNQVSTGAQHMRSSSRPEGGYFAVPPAGVKAYPELLRAAGYYTYTDQKLDYQFSKPYPGTGPSTIWDSEGEAEPNWRGRQPEQPFFGMRNFMVTHESGVFAPMGNMPNSVTHFVMQLMRWWRLDSVPEAKIAPSEVVVPPYYPDTPTVRSDIASHYNNIAYMDAEVAAILEQLEADGLADSTIVIWTTDHGDGLPRAKRELYDSGLRVPMIIRWPEAYRPADVEPGTIDTRLISFVDLAPTLLQLAGVELPNYLQGRDFTSATTAQREYIFAARDRIDEVPDLQRAVRDKRFKYIFSDYPHQAGGHPLAFRDNLAMVREMRALYNAGELNAQQRLWFEPPGQERLFDLQKDPHELIDVSGQPEYAADLQRMRGALAQWQQRVGDTPAESEAAMLARIAPSGEQRVTPAPKISFEEGLLQLQAAESGHSLSYKLDASDWKLYTGALKLDGNVSVEAKAERYGWKASEVVSANYVVSKKTSPP